MAKPYKEVNPNPNFSAVEQNILANWQAQNTFEKSVDNRNGAEQFIFYDGPPFANGLPHYGHLLTGYVKDLFARYQTMQGKQVKRKFGWDCHGLPAEMGTEKELNISGRKAIEDYGIDKFNQHCRTSVMKYANEWEQYVTRQARWVDFDNGYKTMDQSYIESVIWAFKQLYDKGLVYQDMRVMPYSWAAQTPLSNFETRLDNSYRMKTSKAITVAFELADKPNTYVLAWTTTPWTLPSNLALAIGEQVAYGSIEHEGKTLIMAKSSFAKYAKELGLEEDTKITDVPAAELLGANYKPLFPYFADTENAFKIISADFVEEGDGTGIVHLAPGFGEDDFEVCKKHNIPVICPVDDGGCFTEDVPDYQGKQVFEANEPIIQHLKSTNQLIKQEQYKHNYPHCWRTDEPLIYKAVPSWYVEVTKFKDRMVELNQQINWVPGHVKDGLFGKWLENARDWSISRNRFWGAPIPVWVSRSGKIKVFGSIEEIEKACNTKVKSLHRPDIDEVIYTDEQGEEYTRVTDVFDCWFESGSMPYASQGLMGEPDNFPADFIVEYTAQTRGWFYTLMVLSTALFDKPPFLNCICHGVVLDAKGEKLSKRLRNYPDPLKLFDEYGADALRFFMMRSPIMRGQELHIDKEGKFIRDCVRLYIKPLWNAYNFYVLYANADGVKGQLLKGDYKPTNIMDAYILKKCQVAITKIEQALNTYDTPTACDAIEEFFEVLNNWYIRRSKDRFWKTEKDADKQAAYDTLYTCLALMCRAAAPLLPLITEEIYTTLTGEESVHLADFPNPADLQIQASDDLLQMDKAREVCNTALSVRNDVKQRVRQPLASLTIYLKDISLSDKLKIFDDIIKDEINVKAINYAELTAEVGDESLNIISPVLGKRLKAEGKQAVMQNIVKASKTGDWQKANNGYIVAGEQLSTDEAQIKLQTSLEGAAAVPSGWSIAALDLNITDELYNEGIARDLIRLIQQARKEADLDVSDTIKLTLQMPSDLADNIVDFHAYIKEQTLCSDINIGDTANSNKQFNQKLAGEDMVIGIG